MATFKKYRPGNEKELHSIIEKELDALEEELVLLKHEMSVGRSTPDFLCVDGERRLVIIEVKLQEDENVLFQSLRYYSDVDENRYAIAKSFSDKGVNTEKPPRIILIAERFSDDVRRLGTLVVPDVELYEYTVAEDSAGEKGIIYHPVPMPPKIGTTVSRSVAIEDHRAYIAKAELQPVFDRARQKIKSIGDGIDEYTTQSYVGYKYGGRQFAWIAARRRWIDVGAVIIDEKGQLLDYDATRIEADSDNYSDVLEKIGNSFQNLGGVLPA